MGAVSRRAKRKKPLLLAQRRLFPRGRSDYFEAAEAAASTTAEAAASAAALAAAEASGAGAGATTGAGASTLGSSFLLQAVRATAASREANRIDLFILVLKRLNDGAHHNFGVARQCFLITNGRPRQNKTRKTSSASPA